MVHPGYTASAVLSLAALAVGAVALESHAAPDRRALWRAAGLNLGYYLSVMALVTPVVVLATPAIVAAVNRLGGGLIRLPSAGAWFWLSVLVVLLATDLLDYLYHRTEHAVPFLWRLHALHHSEEHFNATTSLRQIWFNQFVHALILSPIVGIVFSVAPGVVLTARLLTIVNNLQVHMGWRVSWGPLWWLVISPQYHRCHHSTAAHVMNKNFAGIFPLWDLVFATCYRPAPGEYGATGLLPSVQPSLADAILWPVSLSLQQREVAHRWIRRCEVLSSDRALL
jgi:sterol desaturase/sphingolipid hydroxylase (fatty acid hydroxylase superfamily)